MEQLVPAAGLCLFVVGTLGVALRLFPISRLLPPRARRRLGRGALLLVIVGALLIFGPPFIQLLVRPSR